MLGVCCEFGMGTEHDVARAAHLYQMAAEQGNATAKLLNDKLKNKYGRGFTEKKLECERDQKTSKQRFVNQQWLLTVHRFQNESTKVVASMLLMQVPLTALCLIGKINTN